MSSITISLIVFACVFGGALLGAAAESLFRLIVWFHRLRQPQANELGHHRPSGGSPEH